MKTTVLTILLIPLIFLITACNGWVIQPGTAPTPFLPSTNTPSIFSPTPVVSVASATPTIPIPTSTSIAFITATSIPTILPSSTSVAPQTTVPSGPAVSVELLGCNTSIDVTHGMGEVTNAFVILRNIGGVELTNLSTTLHALDEGREHPDKTVEVPSLLPGYKVILKLTVDSTYQAETPIQVEVNAAGGLFQRVGAESCQDLGVLAPNPIELLTPLPDNP